jgi:hypothetical protein
VYFIYFLDKIKPIIAMSTYPNLRGFSGTGSGVGSRTGSGSGVGSRTGSGSGTRFLPIK